MKIYGHVAKNMGWGTLRLGVLELLNSALKECVQIKSSEMLAVTKFLWMTNNSKTLQTTRTTTKPTPKQDNPKGSR